jgi:hypothetical protein
MVASDCRYGDALDAWAADREMHMSAGGRMLRSLASSQTGVAPLFILLNAACAAVLVWMPYTLLVEFSMLLSVPSILLFMWSFVALRVQRPYVERPFLIPGGLPVAVLLTIVPVAVSIAYAAIIATESVESSSERPSAEAAGSAGLQAASEGGLPPIFQVASALGVIGLGLVVHLIAHYCSSSSSRGEVVSSSRGHGGRRGGRSLHDDDGYGLSHTPLPKPSTSKPWPLPTAVVRVVRGHAHHAEELEAFNGATPMSQSRSLLREYRHRSTL